MIYISLFAFIAAVHSQTETTPVGQCEDYGEKVTDGWETSTLARLDPCFGYGYSCCTETYGDLCYWKDTYNCNNCELDIGYGGCNACCDSYDHTPNPTSDPTMDPTKDPTMDPTAEVVATPPPTAHSAKKWTMLHPDYEGGDGELLWNIYYGDFSDDERFDAFRKDQLWDAEVIRPIIAMDVKYERFQLNHEALNVSHGKSKASGHEWVVVASIALVLVAAFAMWFKYKRSYKQIADSTESQGLLQTNPTYGQ